ncbi:hypothetical protein Syn7502_03395 [Synechococcus sp. PCC 7502]|uniref:hypothetical protein n=1 Tax=Synechococcus sp. PCC 7502 TaxID=1173263 RepID=UPI00029FF3EF|nr:hypothetical protein [Synechococcus sp. PCC 7502]AFY75247.1 hypothetical protein Syn7502_03395 [Synechococcus sp. PCC 7502]
MKFIELPISGNLINLDQIMLVEHEEVGEVTNAIAHFGNGDTLLISHRDAEFLINVIQDGIYG